MKVLIAYEPSIYSDIAIDDLRRAALPQEGEALIVYVADLWEGQSEVSGINTYSRFSQMMTAVERETRDHHVTVMKEAEESVLKAVDRLRMQLPHWHIGYSVRRGKPAAEILRKADEWSPDVCVLGSQGRSAIGRFFLGSVSMTVAENAKCSVRVVHQRAVGDIAGPPRIIVGALSLCDVERVIRALDDRDLTPGTEVHLIKGDEDLSAGTLSTVSRYAEKLWAGRSQMSVEVRSGDLDMTLLHAANVWAADSIFVVAGDAIDHSPLSNMAATLIDDATCTVEVVR